ncbi:MAG: hypothetical protein L3J28_05325 [Candidatus Polarisedimenticolaceae bacterium]|nr:hypothetical protein [Candidatus Polarisedimenticolaceae bacterium]
MEIWEQLILGGMAALIFFLFRPGIKAALKQSNEAEKDWQGALLPIGAVVLFVFLLIAMAKG